MRYTDEQLKEFARQAVQVDAEEPDFLGVAEQFEEQWKDLPVAEFEEVHRAVHDLACSASVTVTFPGEETEVSAVSVERLAEILWNGRKKAIGVEAQPPLSEMSEYLRKTYLAFATAVAEQLDQLLGGTR